MDDSVRYRLKNLTNENIIAVSKDQFKIGRSSNNDLSIANNRYMSASHCFLEYENGHLFLTDTSSNGTLINRTTKLTKNEPRRELKSGDIIHIVFRKDAPEENIVFQIDLPTIKQTEQSLSIFDEDTQMTSYPSIPPISPIKTQENVDFNFTTTTDVEMKEPPKKEFAMDASDDMEDVLTCVCCQDIMTDPITLEPCLHAFCNDCYSSWEAIQRSCPKCRVKVIGKKKNVVINGILEAYLKAFPYKRPAAKLKEKDSSAKPAQGKYQVGADGMYLNFTQDDEDMDDDNDDDEEDEEDDDNGPFGFPAAPAPAFLMPAIVPRTVNAIFRCRQCPAIGGFAMAAPAGGYQCPPGQNHILCQCCFQPMPDRRDEADVHQHCQVCNQFLCNMYFHPCSRGGCLGCLNRLRDFQFAPQHLVSLVNDNPVETQIVQDYLAINKKTIQDLFTECCDRLDRHEFHCATIDRTLAVPSSKVVCYKCAVKLFRELAYQYRAQMKDDDIHPLTMRQRENCYYGKRCRTQYTKLTHAQRFNHACDQTRN